MDAATSQLKHSPDSTTPKNQVKEDMVASRQKNLQLQMNPHFIFNALTGINMLLERT